MLSRGVRGGPEAAPRRVVRVARAVLSTQLLVTACVAIVIAAAAVLTPDALARPDVLVGAGLVMVALVAAATVPWDRLDRHWVLVLPFLDVIAIVALRQGAPLLGVGLLLIFPVSWVARFSGPRATGAVVVAASGLLWIARALDPRPLVANDFGGLALLPIAIVFVATATFLSSRRARAQRTLLEQHTRLVQNALDSARHQQRTLAAVLDAVPFAVLAFDASGAITLANHAQRRTLASFDLPADAVTHPVVYGADRRSPLLPHERPLARAVAGERVDAEIVWVGDPGGPRAAFACTARTLRDTAGRPAGGVLVAHDVTAELEALRSRDNLLTAVTREVRRPVSAVLQGIDIALRDGGLSPATQRVLDGAASDAVRLMSLLTDLLRAAGEADPPLQLAVTSCDIAAIAREAVEAIRPVAERDDLALDYLGPDSLFAGADPVRIRQVFDDLLANAVAYNREWGSIELALTRQGEEVVVTVSDTGQGIPEAELPRVFDSFYRTDTARAGAPTGSGIGLSTVRAIVQRHGGTLTATSEYGVGSTFRLTLPLAPAPAAVEVAA